MVLFWYHHRMEENWQFKVDLHPSANVIGTDAEILARFLDKIDIPPDRLGCWPWKACIGRQGYGKFQIAYHPTPSHRFSWELSVGPIPAHRQVHHKCENRKCCNPNHLEILTPAEHATRHEHPRVIRDFCVHGHEMTPENTAVYRDQRKCRRCVALRKMKALYPDREPHEPMSQLYCKNGHPLFGPNMKLYASPGGFMTRICKTCQLANQNAYNARNREKVLARKNAAHAKDRAARDERRRLATEALIARSSEIPPDVLLLELKKAMLLP